MKGFRVWDKDEKKMHYEGFMIGTDGELYGLKEYVNFDDEQFVANVIPASNRRYLVMQQYSQCDICGVPLYEQDIVMNEKGNKIILDNEKIISLHVEIGSYICIGNTLETGE